VGVTRDLLDAFASVSIDPDKVLIVVNQIAPKSRLTPQQVERNLGSTIFTIPYGGDNFHRSLDLGRTYLTEFPKEPTAQAIRKLADLLMQRRAERQRQQATATAEAS
jgi:Flp pilus assembly CpaE family ATPase